MRPRHFFEANFVISASLFVLTTGLAVWSVMFLDGIDWCDNSTSIKAISDRGELTLEHITFTQMFRPGHLGFSGGQVSAEVNPQPTVHSTTRCNLNVLGFTLFVDDGGAIKTGAVSGTFWAPQWIVRVPYAAFVIVLALMTAIAWRRLKIASIEPGRCRSCGYDLRASIDRCPECGTPTAVLVPH